MSTDISQTIFDIDGIYNRKEILSMRQELNDQELDMVVGGTVYINGNKMRMKLSFLNEIYDLHNCEDYEAMMVATQLYAQNKTAGDRAYETAVKNAFIANGWIEGQ